MGEHEENGWAEYQKLVLAELERHNKWLSKIDLKLNETLLTFKLEKQMIENLVKLFENLDNRVKKLEDEHVGQDAIDDYKKNKGRYRNWVIGLSVTTIISVATIIVELVVR